MTRSENATLVRRFTETSEYGTVLHFQTIACNHCGHQMTEQLLPRSDTDGGGFDIVGGSEFFDHMLDHDTEEI